VAIEHKPDEKEYVPPQLADPITKEEEVLSAFQLKVKPSLTYSIIGTP